MQEFSLKTEVFFGENALDHLLDKDSSCAFIVAACLLCHVDHKVIPLTFCGGKDVRYHVVARTGCRIALRAHIHADAEVIVDLVLDETKRFSDRRNLYGECNEYTFPVKVFGRGKRGRN